MGNMIIYGERGLSERIADLVKPAPSAGSYLQLKGQVRSMVLYQEEIERLATAGKIYIWARNAVCRIFGYRQKTLDELFSMQLANVSAMNRNLERILYDSRRELNEVEKYYDLVQSEVSASVDSINPKKNALERNLEQYLQLKSEKERCTSREKSYFLLDSDARQLKRKVLEDFHSYNLANETITDSVQEAEFMEVVEDLLRVSIQTCERIGSKAKRMERHIRHTKRAYEEIRRQQGTIVALNGAIATMADFTTQVHGLLGDGMQRMSSIANSPESFYSQAAGNLGFVLGSIREANQARGGEIERQVQRYLGKK